MKAHTGFQNIKNSSLQKRFRTTGLNKNVTRKAILKTLESIHDICLKAKTRQMVLEEITTKMRPYILKTVEMGQRFYENHRAGPSKI